MLRGPLPTTSSTATTSTTTSTTTGSGGLIPGLPSTTTSTTAPSSTTSTVAGTTTSVAHTTTTAVPSTTATTLAHSGATSATTVPSAVSEDHGVIHQLFLNAGANSTTAHTAQVYLDGPGKVLFILVVAFVLTRVVNRLSHRFVNGLRLVSPVVRTTPRGHARVQTLTGAFTQTLRALIWLIAFLEILNQFSIDLTPFVATATVVGAAVGFGAQTLVKDFLAGVLLLAEDQYGVGDHIAIGTGATQLSGTVESLNLRVTRLRGADGGILYVPNGDIRALSNDTETDSQALVDVLVPYGTDLERAGRAAQAAATEMAAEEAWSPEFAGEPFFAGVADATGANGLLLRVMALTRPGQHLRLAREMRLRIVQRLRDEGIAWIAGTTHSEDPPLDAVPPAGLTEPAPRSPRAAKSAATRRSAVNRKQATPTQTAKRATRAARKATRKSD
jgi:small-conductance mechanosensitive channel